MFNADRYWITVAETKGFTNAAVEVLSTAEWDALIDYLAINPLAGDVIPDTAGVRVIRWPAKSQGKSSSIRVIYYFRDLNMPVYILALYKKGERMSISADEKTRIRELVEEIVTTYGLKKLSVYASFNGAA